MNWREQSNSTPDVPRWIGDDVHPVYYCRSASTWLAFYSEIWHEHDTMEDAKSAVERANANGQLGAELGAKAENQIPENPAIEGKPQ